MHRFRLERFCTRVEHDDPASPPARARQALEAYFAGDLNALDGLEVETGGTPFQRQVWSELRNIPVGQTTGFGVRPGPHEV